jgi:hypothetical protein
MSNSAFIRIIGDLHGAISHRIKGRSYFNLIAKAEYSVQLGDAGFPHKFIPDFHKKMASVDETKHVIVLGNHDDYNNRVANALCDFGVYNFPLKNGKFEFFYIRGAYSPDRASRLIGVDWWEEEQLTDEQGWDAIALYEKTKPQIIMTHDCPEEILHIFYGGDCKIDRTNRILQTCFEINRPKIWIFAHHHRNWKHDYKDTTFVCLDGEIPSQGHKMGFIDFDDNGNLIGEPV